MVAAYHPLSKTIRATIGRCARRGPWASLGEPHEWIGHLKSVPGGPGTRLPGWSLPCTTPPQNPMARGRPVRAPSALGESGWASRVARASPICTRGAGTRESHFGGRHRISYRSIRCLWGACRHGPHGYPCEIFVPILALPAASEHAGGSSRVSFAHPDIVSTPFSRAPRRSVRQSALSAPARSRACMAATCGPRRPKGLVVATQGHVEHPAAASRRQALGKKYRTTTVRKEIVGRLNSQNLEKYYSRVPAW